MRTPPPCCRQETSEQKRLVLVIARIFPPEASLRRWK